MSSTHRITRLFSEPTQRGESVVAVAVVGGQAQDLPLRVSSFLEISLALALFQ